MKKLLSVICICTLLLSATPLTALAHSATHSKYKLCTVKNCNKTTNHKHNGKICRPHTKNDGHSYHRGRHH